MIFASAALAFISMMANLQACTPTATSTGAHLRGPSSDPLTASLQKWANDARRGKSISHRRTSSTRSNQRQMQGTDPMIVPQGIWLSRGYGIVFVSDPEFLIELQLTATSCILDEDMFALDGSDGYDLLDATTMEFNIDGLAPIIFDKQDALPGVCGSVGLTPTVGDEGYVEDDLRSLDILAANFREHFAFFEERDLDWEAMVVAAREELQDPDSDLSFFEVALELLQAVDDIHVTIAIPGRDGSILTKLITFQALLAEEWEAQVQVASTSVAPTVDTYIVQQLGRFLNIVSSYMDDDGLRGDFDHILWGKLRHANVGYMFMFSMSPEDTNAAEEELFNAMKAFNDVDSVIFDVRLNTGGTDSVSVFLAALFANEDYFAMSKQAKMAPAGDQTISTFTESYDVIIENFNHPELTFSGRVVVLASESTVSAGEVFTLAMKELPFVTVMGHNTHGAFSDMLGKKLDNGYQVTLSNEVYRDTNGTMHEIVGLPPHVTIETELLALEERNSGEDSWIAAALEELGVPLPNTTSNAPTTPSPTDAPTDAPTIKASDAPTTKASDAPTDTPTDKPTADATAAPTQLVSEPPSMQPTSGTSVRSMAFAIAASLVSAIASVVVLYGDL